MKKESFFPEKPTQNNNSPTPKGLEMYFSPEITEKFAELEQNEKNFRVAEIVDQIIMQEINDKEGPLYAAELGGGAHPDRYHNFFKKLIQDKGHIDWVDISPYMLELAKKYLDNKKYKKRQEVITFINEDIIKYLKNLENNKLDVVLMKYTLDHIQDLEKLFKLLSQKMKPGAKFIATIGTLEPVLKSYSTNARYLYNGEEFPENETRTLKDGDSFTIKFFKVSGDPHSGYLEGAETIKYFHSAEKIKKLAESYGFDIFLGDWKDFTASPKNKKGEIDQNILVLTKK